MAIVIREARADELDEAARVLGVAFEQHLPPRPDVPLEIREAFAVYLKDVIDVRSRLDDAELFVALEADRLVGTATLYPPDHEVAYPGDAPGPRPWPRGWATLRLLGVDPAARGRGIGRMLAEARIRRARALGAVVVGLHTSIEFEVSRSMYQRMGWLRAPEHDYRPMPGIHAEAYFLALG